jgi:ribosomal protein S18 acetylase RimI-like enzyme
MAQQTTVRPLRPGDAEAIVSIDRARTGRSRKEFYAKRFAALAEHPRTVAAVAAEQGGRVVGFAFARVLDGEFGGAAPVGALDAIGVLAEQEREGVATALLAGLEAALAAHGVRELRSQVDWSEHGMTAFFSAAGFRLSARVVLERSLERPVDDEEEEEDAFTVRSMAEQDLPAIVRLDRRITGRDRSSYLARKTSEVLKQSAVRVSLVAEVDGQLAGFLMARVDFGEYGRTEPTAVLDTIGVDPAFARRGVGSALLGQLLRNLGSLRAERVITEVEWNDLPLLGFLARNGFEPAQRLAFDKAIA